jgi:hypothetical protein
MAKYMTKEQMAEYEYLAEEKANGRLLTADGIEFICKANNYDAEAIGKYVCRSENELFDRLSEPYSIEAVQAFRNKYIEIDIDHCTEDICDFVSELLAK